MPADFYEEEDFQGQFKGNVFKRILDLMRPHWPWVLGFLICVIIVSILDAYFTYLSKQIVDKGIVSKDIHALQQILVNYGHSHSCAGCRCIRLCFPGWRAGRTGTL